MSGVYGPTTIDRQNCENGNGISSNLRYISSLTRVKKHQIIRSLPLIISLICLIIGLSLILIGSLGNLAIEKDPSNCILIIVGFILCGISSGLFLFYMKRAGKLYCCPKKTHLDVAGKHVSTNPSTDLLVSATYPPVSDVAYQQSQGDTENSRLMVQEHTILSNEDADRMIESDPRIVLRPLKSANEDC
ncbi:uncharacterized protein [Onthophagus taurus]|uniref:uncharacterized protein n=1 Tax=Onthophagus taurus TaxID=166361 RepID=UPI000C1FD964|nr:uncharacterized protein LOC111413610 [Onthophagus taurus]